MSSNDYARRKTIAYICHGLLETLDDLCVLLEVYVNKTKASTSYEDALFVCALDKKKVSHDKSTCKYGISSQQCLIMTESMWPVCAIEILNRFTHDQMRGSYELMEYKHELACCMNWVELMLRIEHLIEHTTRMYYKFLTLNSYGS